VCHACGAGTVGKTVCMASMTVQDPLFDTEPAPPRQSSSPGEVGADKTFRVYDQDQSFLMPPGSVTGRFARDPADYATRPNTHLTLICGGATAPDTELESTPCAGGDRPTRKAPSGSPRAPPAVTWPVDRGRSQLDQQ
jgi:hypothetical protein